MSGNPTYDKVRAAYGLDDDDLRDLTSSSSSPPEGSIRGGWDPAQRPGYYSGNNRNSANNGNNANSGNGSFGRGHDSAANPPQGIPVPLNILEGIIRPNSPYVDPWLKPQNAATEGSNGGTGNGSVGLGHNAAANQNPGIPINTNDVHPTPDYTSNGSKGNGNSSSDKVQNGIPIPAHLLEPISVSGQPSIWSVAGNASAARQSGYGPTHEDNSSPFVPNPWSVLGNTSTANAGRGAHETPSVPGNGSAAHRMDANYSTTSQNQSNYGKPTQTSFQFNYKKCTDQTTGVPQPPPPAPPPAAPIAVPPVEKVNSVRVPFDPEDQSDDEVVITPAYNRGVRDGQYAQPATPDKPAVSQREPPAKRLSANAASFVPKSACTSVSEAVNQPKPLVDHFVGFGGNPDITAVTGDKYSHYELGFVPWTLVSNYHLWFVGRTNSERIMPYFKQEALLKAQTWDFCYVWRQPKGQKAEHVLLVPTRQFQHFLHRINRTLGIQLIIPTDREGEKFRVHFSDKTPVPRFLGRAADETAFNIMVRNVPTMNARDKIDSLPPPVATIYAKKVEGLLFTYGKDKKALREAKAGQIKLKRKIAREAAGKQIKRVQRYLGLRPNAAKATRVPSPGGIDLTKPVPHAREDDVILVSMDIEAYEQNQQYLTEIGFGILDTRDIVNVPPGAQCRGWFEQIKGRHIRIQERSHMINRRYVNGKEENFNFGESEFVKLNDVLRTVTEVLQPGLAGDKPRKVILVGHNIQGDIKIIANIGYNVKPDTFFEILDTQDIHQYFRRRDTGTSLDSVLNDLEIEHSYMHNGGNDAVYTLQALLSLVIKIRQGSLQRQNERLKPGFVLDADVVAQGWASGGEDSDGGYAEKEQSQYKFTPAKKESSQNASKKK